MERANFSMSLLNSKLLWVVAKSGLTDELQSKDPRGSSWGDETICDILKAT